MKDFKPFPILLVMLLAVLSQIISCQDKSEPTDQALHRTVPAQVKKVEVPGITNFSRIDGTVGFGGATAGFGGATQPSAMARLKNDGFASVINLRLAREPGADVDTGRAAAQAAGLKYIHLPFDPTNPDPQLVDNFLAALGDKANHPVYIHCNSATRVASLWMITRVFEDGWEIDVAREEAEAIALKPSDAVAFATNYITSHRK